MRNVGYTMAIFIDISVLLFGVFVPIHAYHCYEVCECENMNVDCSAKGLKEVPIMKSTTGLLTNLDVRNNALSAAQLAHYMAVHDSGELRLDFRGNECLDAGIVAAYRANVIYDLCKQRDKPVTSVRRVWPIVGPLLVVIVVMGLIGAIYRGILVWRRRRQGARLGGGAAQNPIGAAVDRARRARPRQPFVPVAEIPARRPRPPPRDGSAASALDPPVIHHDNIPLRPRPPVELFDDESIGARVVRRRRN